MKKYSIIFLAAIMAVVACNKPGNGSAEVDEHLLAPGAPEWLFDESLPVPIQFGNQDLSDTKAAITPEVFAQNTFTYCVVSFKNGGNDVMPTFEGGVLARNVDGAQDPQTLDNYTGLKVAQFGDFGGENGAWQATPKYYPYLYNNESWSFYGYRVSDIARDADKPVLNGVNVACDLGSNDIIWAKAEVDPSWNTTAAAGYNYKMSQTTGQEVNNSQANGFSAKYIRGIRWECAHSGLTFTDFLPALAFSHVTSQIKFVVKAFDDVAQNTLANASVAINSIKVGGTSNDITPAQTAINTKASLNVKTGVLTGNTPGTMDVVNTSQEPFAITTTGAQWGEPLFIQPITGNILVKLLLTLPGYAEPQEVPAVLQAPRIPADPLEEEICPAGTFAAGYSYTFTIYLQSIEKIYIKVSLGEWTDAPATDPIYID